MTSVRRTILVRVMGLLLAGSVLMGFLSYRDAAHEVDELFDAQLAQSARVIFALLNEPQDQIDHEQLARMLVESASRHPDTGHPYEAKVAYVVKDVAGEVIAASFTAPDQNLIDWNAGYSSLRWDDINWRTYVLRSDRQAISVWVGERDDIREETITGIVLGTLLPDLIGIPLMLLLVWAAIGSGLKPLERLATQIRHRDPESLMPLAVEALPVEVEPMQAAINRLLHQLEQLLAREQRFIADAAHELRTPLAVIKVHLENAQSAANEEQRQESLAHLSQAVDRSTHLVGQMLALARLSESSQSIKHQERLLESCRQAVSEVLPLALKKNQDIQLIDEPSLPAVVYTEPGAINTLIKNLVANAIRHTPEGSQIVISIISLPDGFGIIVDDSGPGVAEADLPLLSERFFAAGGQQGAGLGLSIVQKIVQRHDGSLSFARSHLGGLRVAAFLKSIRS